MLRKILRLVSVAVMLALLLATCKDFGQVFASEYEQPRLWTTSVDSKHYDLMIAAKGVTRRLARVPVDSIYSNRVVAELSPEGTYVAMVPDFDGRYGTRLVVLSADTGEEITSVEAFVRNFAWAPTEKALAYVAYDKVGVEFDFLPTGTEIEQEVNWENRPRGQLALLDLDGNVTSMPTPESMQQVVGISRDEQYLYVTWEFESGVTPTVEAFGRYSLSSGDLSTILIPSEGEYRRQFKLVRAPQEDLISYVTSTSLNSKGQGPNWVSLARVNGTLVAKSDVNDQQVIDYVWNTDTTYLAYTTPDGLWVMQQDGTEKRVLKGNFLLWELRQIDAAGRVELQHQWGVSHTVDLQRPETLPTTPEVSEQKLVSSTPVNLYAPYIHQVYDTATEFLNGGWSSDPMKRGTNQGSPSDGGKQDACGSTSAVIVMAALGRYSGKPVYVEPSKFSPFPPKNPNEPAHYSTLGGFVSQEYTATWRDNTGTYKSYTFSQWDNYQSGRGAHGYMVEAPKGTVHANFESFFNVQDVAFNKAFFPSTQWIKSQLDQGRLIVASHTTSLATLGHFSVIKGYQTDAAGTITHWIWHDTYGKAYKNTWGLNDGANVAYPVTFTNIETAWAVYLP